MNLHPVLTKKISLSKRALATIFAVALVSALAASQLYYPDQVVIQLGNYPDDPAGNIDLIRLSRALYRCPKARSVEVDYRVTKGEYSGFRSLKFERTQNGRGWLSAEVKVDDLTVNTGGTDISGETCESNIHQWAETARQKFRDDEDYYPLFRDEKWGCS